MAASEQNRCFVRIGTDLYYCFCNQHECYMGKRYGVIKSSDFQKGFDPEGMSCFVSSYFAKATVDLAVVVYDWYVFDVGFFGVSYVCRQSFSTNTRSVFFLV